MQKIMLYNNGLIVRLNLQNYLMQIVRYNQLVQQCCALVLLMRFAHEFLRCAPKHKFMLDWLLFKQLESKTSASVFGLMRLLWMAEHHVHHTHTHGKKMREAGWGGIASPPVPAKAEPRI